MDPLRLNPYHKNRDTLIGTSTRLGILSLLVSLFVILLADWLLVMEESPQTNTFKTVQNTIIQIQVWFVLRTKYHLESTRLWWSSKGSSNEFWNNLVWKSTITMEKMASLLRVNTVRIVTTKGKLIVSQDLVPSIRMQDHNVKSKP